jgi:acyl phosphate:glycerol-3-phosphate acyltransferase
MNKPEVFLPLVGLAYLLGSIPFGKLVGKRRGIDIQQHGSGNIGFANAVRTLGWRPALVVLAGDVAKGFVAVAVAKHYLSGAELLVVAAAAVLGHIFPVWLKFKGGKGIATGLGVTLALSPLLASLAAVVYFAVFAVFRKSAPSSIAAAWSGPLICLVFDEKYAWFYLGFALLASWTHRSNIKQMIRAGKHGS